MMKHRTRVTWAAGVVAAVLVAAPTCRASLTVDVFAYANSSSGGTAVNTISVTAGQLFSVLVDPNDLWNAGALPRWSNADGLVTYLYATGSDESGQPAGTLIGQPFPLWTQNGFTAPYGALVGKIGTSYMLIGTTWINKPSPATGTLQLMYWDSNYYDNTDKISALAATILPIPEPTTMLAGALLLLPFGFSTIRFFRKQRTA